MAIGIDEVRHIARLVNLEFEENELQILARQLNSILVYIEKLSELDTDKVEPTSHLTQIHHAFREDRVVPSNPVSEALANAPETQDGHFTVPRVIG